jgi:ABC-type transport system involved in multi-copper enzyme maturation permease subunit
VFVSPTLSGNAINGDRDAATLAPVQVTLATTGEILLGKFLAAWTTGLAFIVVAIPFIVTATLMGGISPLVFVISIVVLIIEIGVVAGIGVALSGILARPLFSVASTYLVVATLVIGTLIAFALGGVSNRSEVVSHSRYGIEYDQNGFATECSDWETYTYEVPRFDAVWWMLALNPFVILADATPTTFGEGGYPVDLFGQIKFGVRSAQTAPDLESRFDECDREAYEQLYPTPEEVIAKTTPSWFVGLALQLVLVAGLLWWAWARTRTPARSLPPGTRIA